MVTAFPDLREDRCGSRLRGALNGLPSVGCLIVFFISRQGQQERAGYLQALSKKPVCPAWIPVNAISRSARRLERAVKIFHTGGGFPQKCVCI